MWSTCRSILDAEIYLDRKLRYFPLDMDDINATCHNSGRISFLSEFTVNEPTFKAIEFVSEVFDSFGSFALYLRKVNLCSFICSVYFNENENRDMGIAMSSSRADPVLGLNIPSSCPGWGYLNM